MNREHVILVDHYDRELGIMEKMEAHRRGILHRAVSVFLVNSRGQWLLQRRAAQKYHSARMWSNAACTHPQQGETNLAAARRRLRQELGIDAELTKVFDFVYRANLDAGLTEHEFDHVFIGVSDQIPKPDPQEVMDYRYVDYQSLEQEIHQYPDMFTKWFRLLYWRVAFSLEEIVNDSKI